MNDLFNLKKEVLVTGRAATAIYLFLKNKFYNIDVIVPANICYAAVFPIVLSGNNPIFSDVESDTGNISLRLLKKYITKKTQVAIVPHMYGNPVEDIESISIYCKNNNIILVEDCASAMGAFVNDKEVGSFGNYSLFSTGYSKTIDLGMGGFLLSDNNLETERLMCEKLSKNDNDVEFMCHEFSKRYRIFRNSNIDYSNSDFRDFIENSDLRKMFLFKADNDYVHRLSDSLKTLNDIIIRRRENNKLYDKLLDLSKPWLRTYCFSKGAVPWRKNIFVDKCKRNRIVEILLKNKVPVSDWYPSISTMFGDNKIYPNVDYMEHTILNFPLLISEIEINRICSLINKID